MVVVAIIGILSAVALPTYRKFTQKARASEAKLKLANVKCVFQSNWPPIPVVTGRPPEFPDCSNPAG